MFPASSPTRPLPSSDLVDPTLAALFASSARVAASRSKPSGLATPTGTPCRDHQTPGDGPLDKHVGGVTSRFAKLGSASERRATSHTSANGPGEDISPVLEGAEASTRITRETVRKSRKRKREVELDVEDLETRYLRRFATEGDHGGMLSQKDLIHTSSIPGDVDGDAPSSHDNLGLDIPVHESLSKESKETEVEKASRTVFLSNVSTEAITSAVAKKTLLAHLSTVLDTAQAPSQRIESLRFRSVPFSTSAMPKRAAYITKALMEATTKSVNAYVVYSSSSAARAAVSRLNGSVVLERHLRTDSVAHPSPVDHRRCVFVGNLGFVDDESVLNTVVNQEGEEQTQRRKRTKVPMDVEEGLWRTFGKHAGKVESVRVIRDETTRVGKGIAYVQFTDVNSVEAALHLSGKKFPPMLPRDLRVSRCRAPHKTARAVARSQPSRTTSASHRAAKSTKYTPKPTTEEQTHAGRAARLLGHAAASRNDRSALKREPEESTHHDRIQFRERRKATTTGSVVFEGQRASVGNGTSKGKPRRSTNTLQGGGKVPSNNKQRQARRVARWREKQSGQ